MNLDTLVHMHLYKEGVEEKELDASKYIRMG